MPRTPNISPVFSGRIARRTESVEVASINTRRKSPKMEVAGSDLDILLKSLRYV
jgi:hypothetical protein